MTDLQGRRILVTGAAGFIGANLARSLLDAGGEVHAVVRPSTDLWRIAEIAPRLTLHRLDLTRIELVQRTVAAIRPEVILHLAAPGGHPLSQRKGTEMLVDHLLGTANLLEATAPLDYRRFVHFGSSLEYGPRKRPHRESDLLQPSTVRGAAKAAATLLCQQFARANRRPIVVLRPFSVYGYWEGPARLVPTAIRAVLLGQGIALTEPGYRRDLIFAGDVVDACLLAVESKSKKVTGEVINVGSGQQWSNEEVVEIIQALAGRRVSVRVGAYPSRPSDTGNWVADIRKAKRLLGWAPRRSLQAGLERTIAWFRQHGHVYDGAEER